MLRSNAVARLAAMVSLLVAAPASAEPADDIVSDDVVLAHGQLQAALSYEANISNRANGEPWSLAPDLSFGVTDELTIGVVHSARALSLVDSGLGFCLSAHGCRGVYDDAAVDSRYRILHRDGFTVAARLRFVNHAFSPYWKPSLRPGFLAKWQSGRFAIITDPQLQFGLAHRDRGNRDWLRWPVWLAVQPVRHVMIALRTGVEGELATWSDTYLLALGLDMTVRVLPSVDVSAIVAFAAVLGPLNDGGNRHMGVTVTWRWP